MGKITKIDLSHYKDTTLYAYFFQGAEISSITIPNTISVIQEGVFASCIGLISVVIPNSVTKIGYRTFYLCTSLSSITYKGTVAQWNAIEKGEEWHYNVPSTTVVTCTDGTVALD